MELKKKYILISALIIFWIIVIGWGMMKTLVKLTQKKTAVLEESQKEPQKQTEVTKSQEPTPAPAVTEPRAILVRTVRAKAMDFQDVLPVMGTVRGKTEIELKFEINGVIKTIYFGEGEKVNKGDLIASLDPKDAELKFSYSQNKFNSSQAAYNSAQKKLEVYQKLFEAGAIIKSKLEEVELECESAKFQAETARSEMGLAENELKKTSLYATKDGLMGPREAEEGEFVTPQDKIGSLLEISEVFIEVGIVERDIDKIKLGQHAKVYVDAYPQIAFEGTVENIFPVVEGKSRTLTAKIKVPNPQELLLPGMFSRAEIFICELKDSLIIPTTTLVHAGGGITLIPVIPVESLEKTEDQTENGTVQLRQVKLGYITSDYAQIVEGLKADELIVIEAQGELKDNVKVKIVGTEELNF